MNNTDDIIKRILLNMRYDSKMTLKENYNVVLVEQSAKVGDYIVTYEKEYNRVKIDSPTGKTYYWTPSDGKWSRIEFNDQYVDLDSTKDKNAISVLSNVFKKSGIGSVFYIKNTDQGNKFRSWVINKDPEFAKTINLSPKGDYDNEYIRKAWVKYGQQYKDHLKQIKSEKLEKELKPTTDFLTTRGFDPSGAVSENQAYALAVVRGTKKLTDKSTYLLGGGLNFQSHSVCVKKVGSTCAPGSYLIVDSFNMDMAQKINSLSDVGTKELGLKPPQYTYLQNFYFNYGKIMEDLNSAFKYDKDAYKSDLFPDGWWNWFTEYWGTDNLNKIKIVNPNSVNVKDHNKYEKGYTIWSTEFVHDALSFIELGTLALGMFYASPVLLGISTAAGLGDAATYFAEGDKYMGSMMIALEIIPGGEFLKVFKNSKTAVKLGKEGTKELIEKGVKGGLKGNDELLFTQLKTELKSVTPNVAKATQEVISKNITENLSKNFLKVSKGLSLSEKINLFFNTLNIIWRSIGTIPQMVIKVGGTAWGIDQLYLAYFGRDEDRQKSDIRTLYYLIQNKGLPEEEMVRVIGDAQKYVDPKNLAETTVKQNDPLKFHKENYEKYKKLYDQNVKNKKTGYFGSGSEVKLVMPSINDVIDGKETIIYGMSGNDLMLIKRNLKTNYSPYLDPKIDNTLNNPKFDDDFFDVLIDFQNKYMSENVSEYGKIGKETYNLIMNPSKISLKPKTLKDITVDNLENYKNDYNFYIWSNRLGKWNETTFDDYKRAAEMGTKTTYTPKIMKNTTSNNVTNLK